MKHAFTIDLEEWFCTHNFQHVIKYNDWEHLEKRVENQADYLLKILDENNVKATFFILGWVADHFPSLIRRIARGGHEIGSHGYVHWPTWRHTPYTFEQDLLASTNAIEKITRKKPTAFRAPAFSIVKKTQWALDVLAKSGYLIDSSIYPIGVHPEYGMPDASLIPEKLKNGMVEVPMSCIHVLGKRIPISGGAYFRFSPYPIFKNFVKHLEREGRALNFYIHPWEIDPGIPHVKNISFVKKIRHYTGLKSVRSKLNRLLKDFEFGTISEVFLKENGNALDPY